MHKLPICRIRPIARIRSSNGIHENARTHQECDAHKDRWSQLTTGDYHNARLADGHASTGLCISNEEAEGSRPTTEQELKLDRRLATISRRTRDH